MAAVAGGGERQGHGLSCDRGANRSPANAGRTGAPWRHELRPKVAVRQDHSGSSAHRRNPLKLRDKTLNADEIRHVVYRVYDADEVLRYIGEGSTITSTVVAHITTNSMSIS